MTDSLIESRQVNKQSSPFPAPSFSNFKLQGPPDTDIQAGSALDSSVPRSFGGKPFQPLLNQVIPGLNPGLVHHVAQSNGALNLRLLSHKDYQ